jgi:hypothetical protein
MASDPYNEAMTDLLVDSHYYPGEPVGSDLTTLDPFIYFASVGYCPECDAAGFETRADRCPICNCKMEGH